MKYTKADQAIIDKIEALLPKLAIGRPCFACAAHWKNTPATRVIKHLSGQYPDVEYMPENLTPVCDACASLQQSDTWLYDAFMTVRSKQKKGTFGGRCIARGKTTTQALKEIYSSLKEKVLL